MNEKYIISTDKEKLNIHEIHDFLCNRSYWAKGRDLDQVRKSINNSICFGLYDMHSNMLGFARVVSDGVAFAYLMDVFILEEYRGQGLGRKLVQHIIDYPDFEVRLFLLGTWDAHGLYKKLGFKELVDPSRYLAIVNQSRC